MIQLFGQETESTAMSTDKNDHSFGANEPSEVSPPTSTHPQVPRLAFYLYYSGGLLYMIHCIFHMCMCGQLAHDDGLGGYPVDLAWLALWGGAMLAVARHYRRNNWRFYFSIFVVGFLSFGLQVLAAVLVFVPLHF